MSENESGGENVTDNTAPKKKNMIPTIVFLLVIVFAGGGIAFGLLWFTNRPTQGEDTAAFLPPDTKLAIHVSGLAGLYEETKKWGVQDMLGMVAGSQTDMSGLEKVVEYCKTQVRGDCRMLVAVRELEAEDPNVSTSVEPILMLEGREHQAMLKLLAASGEFGDLKLEDEGPDIKKVAIGGGQYLYLTNRGPFIAASRDVKHIKFLNLSKDKPYKSSASQAWLQQWTNSQMGLMLDVPAWRKRFEPEWNKAKEEMQNVQQAQGGGLPAATLDMYEAMFDVADDLKNSTRGLFGFIKLDGDGLQMQVVADVKEDSAFGKSLPALQKENGEFSLLESIPEGYAFYAGTTSAMTKFAPLAKMQQAIQKSVLGTDATSVFESMGEIASGTSFVFGQGLSQVAVYEATKTQETLAQIIETYKATKQNITSQMSNIETSIEENAGELDGIKFHKVTTDLGLDQLDPGGETGAMMGMMFGSGVMTQWLGADETYVYQMTGPQLEDLQTTLDHVKNKKQGAGSDPAFKESLARIASPKLAGGLLDLETLVAPVAMFIAPGLIKPGDSPLYVVFGMSAPQNAVALDFWLPKKLVEKAQQVATQMSSGGMGGMGGMGGGMGGGANSPDPFGSFDDNP